MRKVFTVRNKFFISLLLAVPVLTGLLLILPKNTALAANPTTMNFQGKVVNSDGTNVSNGSYTFVFRLYSNSATNPNSAACASETTCWWEETQTSVSVTNGIFQVELGAICAFTSACNSGHSGINWNTNSAMYLTMNFNSDAQGYMTPLIHLQTVPYAFNSDSLQGLNASNFVQLAQGVQNDTSTTNPSIYINKNNASGTPNILQLQKAGNDVLVVNNSGNLILGKTGSGGIDGTLVFNTATASNYTVTLKATGNTASYTLKFPTSAPGTSQCIKTDASDAELLTFASCGGGGGTLASDYNSTGTSGNTITLASAGGGVLIQDASTPISGNLFAVQENGATATFFSVSTTTITMQDASANDALLIDLANSEIKVCSSASNCGTNYASITANNTSATFRSNTGDTYLGSGTGSVSITSSSGNAVTITAAAASTWSTSSGALTITSNQAATWSTSAGNLTLQGGSGTVSLGSSSILTASGALNVQSAAATALTVTGNASSTWSTSTGNLTLQGGAALILDAASGSTITLGNTGSGNYIQLAATTRELSFFGSARHSRTVTLTPEFPGATLTGDTSNNTGTMSSDFCSGSSRQNLNTAICTSSTESHNYYAWTSTGANDYEVWVRWQVPSDFSAFSSGSFYGWKTASGDAVTLNIYNNSSSTCASQATSSTTGSWQSNSITMTGCTPSPGDVLNLDIHLGVASSGNFARVGEISLTYLSKW